MEEIHRGRFVCLCSSLCPLYILGRMNCCERRSLWAVGLTYRHEGKSSPDYCCCGMDSFSWSSQHEGHPNCLVSSSPFVLDWCVHVYVHPYLCVCVCMYVGIWCLSSVSLPTLEQCPAVLPISTLIWMLLGRKRKSALLVLTGLWLILRWSVLFQKPDALINVICWNWSSFPVSSPA